ncbi:MAG: CopG family ribbon-helix-helix protein [Candidatus Hodarchaeota archaeon]
MPIISISINEQLREFINKLVSKNRYENKSKLIRDALLRLMSTIDVSSIEAVGEITPSSKNIVGNLIIVAPLDSYVQRKLNKIESEYNDQIVSKNQHFQGENSINFLIFEGEIQAFQNFVVEINGIKEIKNFRYLIIN